MLQGVVQQNLDLIELRGDRIRLITISVWYKKSIRVQSRIKHKNGKLAHAISDAKMLNETCKNNKH